MADYECPDCGGGFPEPKPTENDPECPWCGEKLNATKTDVVIPRPTVPGSGNIEGNPFSPSVQNIDSSTTPCPECGDDMPMISWQGPKPVCRKCRRGKQTL